MQGRKGPAPLSSFSAAWVGHVDPAQARCSGGYRVTGSTGDFSFPVSEPTSSGTTNPSLGKSKPLHHPSLRLGAKAPLGEGLRSAVASGGGSAVCRLLWGRVCALPWPVRWAGWRFCQQELEKRPGALGRGTWGPGTGEVSTHSQPSLHSPEHTKPAEQPQWNRTQLGPLLDVR